MSSDRFESTTDRPYPTDLMAEIVMAYVGYNTLHPNELPRLIVSVATTLNKLCDMGAAPAEVEVERLTPAAIRKSVTPDAIISFIDGKPYKTLKRHLSRHGLDPYSYRERYGLPNDYPMTAPSYSERRSAVAKAAGLGRPGGRAEQAGE